MPFRRTLATIGKVCLNIVFVFCHLGVIRFDSTRSVVPALKADVEDYQKIFGEQSLQITFMQIVDIFEVKVRKIVTFCAVFNCLCS